MRGYNCITVLFNIVFFIIELINAPYMIIFLYIINYCFISYHNIPKMIYIYHVGEQKKYSLSAPVNLVLVNLMFSMNDS